MPRSRIFSQPFAGSNTILIAMLSLKQPVLYFSVLLMTVFVFLTALGGGLFGQTGFWQTQWQHQAFANLCHQIPERSFWIGGQPMAVCSRCFGIYTGFLTGWLMLPLWTVVNFNITMSYKKIFFLLIGINIIDVLGNLLGIWQNTLASRFILGFPVGFATAELFSGSFFKKIKQKESYYGGITKSGT